MMIHGNEEPGYFNAAPKCPPAGPTALASQGALLRGEKAAWPGPLVRARSLREKQAGRVGWAPPASWEVWAGGRKHLEHRASQSSADLNTSPGPLS